ncbi:HNH endonuclease family protein [Streptomyces sp. JNUCC 64]
MPRGHTTHQPSADDAPTTRGRSRARRWSAVTALATGLSAVAALTGPPAHAAPPTPVNAATARLYLSQLTVAPEGSSAGYSRSKFPHWSTVSGTCNTREVVLDRDGTDVVQNASCAAVSGTWFSAYDDAVWTVASDLDIDHVVPLSEAWRSGADGWTNNARKGFANDLVRPQLIAVTDNVNQAKGDKDPAEWLPPSASYHCVYARMWVQVKKHYALDVDAAEKSVLQNVLAAC